MLQTELLIGTVGWEHEKWVGGFYPSDLPGDWRFGYYSNRLRSVLVPESFWRKAEAEGLIETIQEDLYPEFRMVLQWSLPESKDARNATQAFLELSRVFDDNVDAYLVNVPRKSSPGMLQAMELLQQYHPVCICCVDAPPAREFSEIEGVSQCWRPELESKPVPSGAFLVTLTQNTEPRAIREIIEQVDAWPEGRPLVQGAALFFENDKAADTAFQARTIAELMGV